MWYLKFLSLCNIDVPSLLSAIILNNFAVLHNYCAFLWPWKFQNGSLFILFIRMPFSYPFCYIRSKICFLVSFSDLHTFLPLVHVNLLWPLYPSLSSLHGDINFFLEIPTLHKFPKKEIYYFHNCLCVAVPMIYNFLFRKFLWKSLSLSWSHDFLRNLSLHQEIFWYVGLCKVYNL